MASPVLAWPLGSLALSKGVVVGIFLLRYSERSHHQNARAHSIQSEAISSWQIENYHLPLIEKRVAIAAAPLNRKKQSLPVGRPFRLRASETGSLTRSHAMYIAHSHAHQLRRSHDTLAQVINALACGN